MILVVKCRIYDFVKWQMRLFNIKGDVYNPEFAFYASVVIPPPVCSRVVRPFVCVKIISHIYTTVLIFTAEAESLRLCNFLVFTTFFIQTNHFDTGPWHSAGLMMGQRPGGWPASNQHWIACSLLDEWEMYNSINNCYNFCSLAIYLII